MKFIQQVIEIRHDVIINFDYLSKVIATILEIRYDLTTNSSDLL